MTAEITTIDLSPADVIVRVIAGEPHTFVMPITNAGAPVDVAAEYPNLVSRVKVGDAATVESTPAIVETNKIVVVIPALTYGVEAYWELRDATADQTWVSATFVIDPDLVP